MRLALLLLAGCEWVTLPIDTSVYDADGDGYDSLSDCDDYNEKVYPLNDESCNGVDNNCSGDESDADDATVWYPDADGDDYGEAEGWILACDSPIGYVANAWDCDDTDNDRNPSAAETDCTSPIDFDCDGYPASWDGDGDGSPSCVDCNDGRAAAYPGADELCNGSDDDCDGLVDEEVGSSWYTDIDADGWGDPATAVVACERPAGSVADGTDCDDADATLHPDAAEACNAIDDDCDGEVDEYDRFGNARWYRDSDDDTFGDASDWVGSCSAPEGYVADDTDCDDTDDTLRPNADESCDAIDQDCDGEIDEDPVDAPAWYNDSDRDGYGNAGSEVHACDAPARHVANWSDCDDSDPRISPADAEVCNYEDDNCDGEIDEAGASGGDTWYPDLDADGYGDESAVIVACTAPSGSIALGGDCDDTDPDYNPDALEVDCSDPADYNCDGSVGEDDTDADGWVACEDCDDSDATRSPDADEDCDRLDDDCDGYVDEDAVDADLWYTDLDGDGYGAGEAAPACEAPADSSTVGGDCDDTDSAISPAGTESCATEDDDDCDGDTNLGGLGCTDWHTDVDGDSYGGADTLCLCDAEDPYTTANGSDCDDTDETINPAAVEVCGSGVDDNCDAVASGCGVAGQTSLSEADAKIVAASLGDSFGTALLAADLEGDGRSELFISAPGYAAGSGAVYRFDDPLGSLDAADASATWLGAVGGDAAGRALTLVDLDGDGVRELAIGTPYEDTNGSAAGVVYLFADTTTSASVSAADSTLFGPAAGEYTGLALGYLAGSPEQLVVSAVRESTLSGGAGAVYVLDGPFASTETLGGGPGVLLGGSSGDFFGRAVASADFDGDGQGDVVVGAYGDDTNGSASGSALFYSGPIRSELSTAEATAERLGVSRGDNAGYAVAAGGDVDGDGFEDAWVGAFNNADAGTAAGAVYLVRGPMTGVEDLGDDATLLGETAQDSAGTCISIADFNGDDYADVAVAGDGLNYGTVDVVWVVYGPVSGTLDLTEAEAILLGEDTNDGAGDGLAGADHDADGYAELIVGAPDEDTIGSDAGAAYILRGGLGL